VQVLKNSILPRLRKLRRLRAKFPQRELFHVEQSDWNLVTAMSREPLGTLQMFHVERSVERGVPWENFANPKQARKRKDGITSVQASCGNFRLAVTYF
jgi:hypothetical protein